MSAQTGGSTLIHSKEAAEMGLEGSTTTAPRTEAMFSVPMGKEVMEDKVIATATSQAALFARTDLISTIFRGATANHSRSSTYGTS